MRRTSIAKHYQIIDLSLIASSILRVLLNWVFPLKPWKYLALTSRRWVCRALFCIRISSRSPKGKTGLPFSWQHDTERYLLGDWAIIGFGLHGTHQLKKGTTPIMMWWLPGWSFSVDTVLSAQHHQVCNKTDTKLSTLGSVSSYLSFDYIYARTQKQPCVWVPLMPKCILWVAMILFVQTLLTQWPCAHKSPDPNVIVNVYRYDGN